MINSTSRRKFLSKAAIAAAITPFASLSTFGQGYEEAIDKTPKRSAPADLKITDVKCGYIRGSVMVKIYTNQDIWGCGEGVDAIPGTYHLVKNFGARLKGKNPLNVHRLFEDIRRSGFFQGAQSGMYVAVLSAIETALWDIAGKALNLPVYQLLGGKFRDKVRVYCDTALYQRTLPVPKDFADAALKAKGMGFNAMKFDLDQPMIQINMMLTIGQQVLQNYKECMIKLLQPVKQLVQKLTFLLICTEDMML